MARRGRWVAGGVLIVVGVALLSLTTGAIRTGGLLRYAPSLLILLGLYSLLSSRLRHVFGPLLLILLGAGWQLVALDRATVDEVLAYWPALIVALGLAILLRRPWRHPTIEIRPDGTGSGAITVFGSTHRRLRDGPWPGGDLVAVFGSSELDCRDAAVEAPAALDAVAVFGEATVRVPRDWTVAIDAVEIAGRVEDRRTHSPPPGDRPDLALSAAAVFGTVAITD